MNFRPSSLLRVQTLFPEPFIGRRGTDHLYYHKLKELERFFPVVLRCLDALAPVVLANVLYAVDALWGRVSVRRGLAMPGWWATLRRCTFLSRAMVSSQADLVFTNFFLPVNRLTIPIILEADFFVYGPPDRRRMVERWLHIPQWFVRRAAVVVVRHELSRAAFAARFPNYAEKAVVVPFYLPWVEPISREDVVRKFRRRDEGEQRLLFVGNDAKRKGLPNLLEAYVRLRRTGRRIHLTVISEFRDGPISIPEGVTVGKNLSPRDVFELMSRAHVFAMPTRQDASPLVFWEAMAGGCALLVPATSPHRELFGDYGIATEPDNVDAIAGSLQRLLDDEEYALGCALRGRQVFMDRYHHLVVGKQYWELFRRTVEGFDAA
jgi:glycosyltransferase involved in cell wall biosynthesis